MLALGGTGILLQGGLHPDLRIDYYENLLRSIKRALPAGASALLFRAGNSLHRGSLESQRARYDRAPARRRPRLHSRRRRGNSRRRNSPAHLAPQVQRRRMGTDAPHRALAGPAHHRHHDVRLRRGVSPSRESFRARPPHSGRHRRIHRVHSLDFRAGKHVRWARKCPKPPPSIT